MHALIFSGLMTVYASLLPPFARGDSREAGARLCDRLECSDTQRIAISRIHARHQAEIQDEKAKITVLRMDMAAEFAQAKLDERALRRISRKMERLRGKIADARIEAMARTHALLTPPQRAKLATAWTERPRHGGRYGYRRGSYRHRGPGRRG